MSKPKKLTLSGSNFFVFVLVVSCLLPIKQIEKGWLQMTCATIDWCNRAILGQNFVITTMNTCSTHYRENERYCFAQSNHLHVTSGDDHCVDLFFCKIVLYFCVSIHNTDGLPVMMVKKCARRQTSSFLQRVVLLNFFYLNRSSRWEQFGFSLHQSLKCCK